MINLGTVQSNNLSVKVTESEVETKEKGTEEEESARESESNILDVSSDYPRGVLTNYKNICVMCLNKGGKK